MSGVEIIGLAASVLQIAEIGGKLSVKLFTFTRKVKNANKSIDALSQDIAATGAVLKELGQALNNDAQLRVCSQSAIDTAKSLVDDTRRVFSGLEKLIDGDSKSSKSFGGISLKQRIKFPFVESKIEEVQANLERLKSSLLVILNVLIFAEQVRNQEALPILKDQRQLIKALVSEKKENEQRYDKLLKAIDDGRGGQGSGSRTDATILTKNLDPSLTSLSTAATLIADDSASTVSRTSSQTQADPFALPVVNTSTTLKRVHEQIHHHSLLVQNMLTQISSSQYKLRPRTRNNLSDDLLCSHWKEWSNLRLMNPLEHFEGMLAPHEDVARYWAEKGDSDKWWVAPTQGSHTTKQQCVAATDAARVYSTAPGRQVLPEHRPASDWDGANAANQASTSTFDGDNQAAQDIAFEREYVLIEKRGTKVNALADELPGVPGPTRRCSSSNVPVRRATSSAKQVPQGVAMGDTRWYGLERRASSKTIDEHGNVSRATAAQSQQGVDRPVPREGGTASMIVTNADVPDLGDRSRSEEAANRHTLQRPGSTVPSSEAIGNGPSPRPEPVLATRAKYQFEADSEDESTEGAIDTGIAQLMNATKRLNKLGESTRVESDAQKRNLEKISYTSDTVDDKIALNSSSLDEIDELVMNLTNLKANELRRSAGSHRLKRIT